MAAPRPLDLSRGKRVALGAAVGLGVGLLLLAIRQTNLAESLEAQLVDVRTRSFVGQRDPDPQIVLCTIEDDDVADVVRGLGQRWPWPLEINATIFRVFHEAKTRAVAVDVFHLDYGQGSDDAAISKAALTPAVAQVLDGEAGDAEMFGAVLKEFKRAALAYELSDSPKYETPARAALAKDRLQAAGIAVPDRGPHRRGANLPIRRLLEAVPVVGFANVDADVDEITRRVHVVGAWNGRPSLSLPLATAVIATEKPARVDGAVLAVGDARQRLDEDGSFLLNFRGQPRHAYKRIPASRVLEWGKALQEQNVLPSAAKSALEGKIVVWGVNLAGLKDVVATPLQGTYDGPELQATAIDNLLHGDGRVRAPRGLDLLFLLGLAVIVGEVGMVYSRRGIVLVAASLALAFLFALAWGLFSNGYVLDLVTPSVAIVLTATATLVLRLLTEGRYNRWLEGAFGLYLAPVVIDAIKKEPSRLDLGGVRREITILFSDIAGFSKFSRKLEPQQLVKLLNEYLTLHSDPVLAEGGVIDKFIGDAVMAFFGDPLPQPDHALRACRAALGVQAAIPSLRPLWESLGLDHFEVRIGLNSGPAVTGNMGSARRLSYTAMGDSVNLASRLEGANKYFGSKILLGPATYEGAKASVIAKQIARVVVVGWDQPEPVYELLGLTASAAPDLVAHVAAFARAQEAARAGDLDGAERALAEAERLRPGDGPSAWFRARLAAMRAGSEATPWSGIVVLEGK